MNCRNRNAASKKGLPFSWRADSIFKKAKYMKKLFLCFLAACLGASGARAQSGNAPQTGDRETVAVFVRADGETAKVYLDMFDAALCAKVNSEGFSVVSRKVAVSELSNIGAENSAAVKLAGASKLAEALRDGTLAGSEDVWTSASMLSVARMLGADFLLDAVLFPAASEERVYSDMGVDTVSVRTVMRASYSLYETGSGRGLAGNTVLADKTVRQSKNLAIIDRDSAAAIVDELAAKIASSLRQDRPESESFVAKSSKNFDVHIVCFIEGMRFPVIEKTAEGEYIVGEKTFAAEASGVSVMLDGLMLGGAGADSKTGNVFSLPSGVHQIRFERADLQPYARMINVSENMKTFSVYLRMSDSARERWKADSEFFESLKAGSKLSDAQVKVLEGLAESYKNSGFRVYYKTDTDQPPTIQQNTSLLPQPILR